jgi:hypothetical protein
MGRRAVRRYLLAERNAASTISTTEMNVTAFISMVMATNGVSGGAFPRTLKSQCTWKMLLDPFQGLGLPQLPVSA